ncbi:MAG: TIGR00341 family protein [Thermodesulfobacterium sp.]|nr:TIGR00341 family protein [Thermodesulfobacterium sp.]
MSLRLIELYHRKGETEEIDFLFNEIPRINIWHDHLPDDTVITKILLKSEYIDEVISIINRFFSRKEDYRLVVLPVEATIPRIEEKEEKEKKEEKEEKKDTGRISVEELYQKIEIGSTISSRYLIMTVLASLVAAIGLLKNDVAIIIGSMVIAPLMGPYMGLSLSTVLADKKLALKTLPAFLSGIIIPILIGLISGLIMDFDPLSYQLASRSDVSHYYILLALASGVAGTYATTKGVQEALVGVMVAVALLPPLVAAGIFAGGGYTIDALGTLILFGVNAVCINLSGVITFYLEGIKPIYWWETEKAKKAVAISIFLWLLMLAFLVLLIYFEQKLKGRL